MGSIIDLKAYQQSPPPPSATTDDENNDEVVIDEKILAICEAHHISLDEPLSNDDCYTILVELGCKHVTKIVTSIGYKSCRLMIHPYFKYEITAKNEHTLWQSLNKEGFMYQEIASGAEEVAAMIESLGLFEVPISEFRVPNIWHEDPDFDDA